ncbi:MAG: ATPase, partial [Gammaproteobacteria bacterium]|nr:ATPase [Gammaproteobacteria bacterium]
MKFSVKEFREWPHKNLTLLGMSGVGKTRLSNMLPA